MTRVSPPAVILHMCCGYLCILHTLKSGYQPSNICRLYAVGKDCSIQYHVACVVRDSFAIADVALFTWHPILVVHCFVRVHVCVRARACVCVCVRACVCVIWLVCVMLPMSVMEDVVVIRVLS